MKVPFKLDKKASNWIVLPHHAQFNLHHTCSPLPNFAITATGLCLLREEKDLTRDEVEFMHSQFSSVGITPRALQYNFRQHFKSIRVPSSALVYKMRKHYSSQMIGMDEESIKKLLQSVNEHNEKGGIGKYHIDSEFK